MIIKYECETSLIAICGFFAVSPYNHDSMQVPRCRLYPARQETVKWQTERTPSSNSEMNSSIFPDRFCCPPWDGRYPPLRISVPSALSKSVWKSGLPDPDPDQAHVQCDLHIAAHTSQAARAMVDQKVLQFCKDFTDGPISWNRHESFARPFERLVKPVGEYWWQMTQRTPAAGIVPGV